jgi:hypothetical protein
MNLKVNTTKPAVASVDILGVPPDMVGALTAILGSLNGLAQDAMGVTTTKLWSDLEALCKDNGIPIPYDALPCITSKEEHLRSKATLKRQGAEEERSKWVGAAVGRCAGRKASP